MDEDLSSIPEDEMLLKSDNLWGMVRCDLFDVVYVKTKIIILRIIKKIAWEL